MQMKKSYSGIILIILVSFLVFFTVSCKKDSDKPAVETGTMTDIEGNVYKTIKIGNQWWMAENLKVRKYRNGDDIDSVAKNLPDSAWANKKTGAYCYFEEKFGMLYNFYSIKDSRNIAPVGWHIPADDEWKEMEQFLGMTKEDADKINWRGSDQGNKLKIAGGNTMYWAKSSDIYTVYGTNESGFTAIGGACRIFNGQWGEITHTGFWWTSSLDNGNGAMYRGLDYDKTTVFRYYGPENYGFSIRCVRD